MPFILNEDAALKYKLQGITVTDRNSASMPGGVRPVKVMFRLPEDEIINLPLPCIVLELDHIQFAEQRQHQGQILLPYAPEGEPVWWDESVEKYDSDASPYRAAFPYAYDIYYKVTVYSRLSRDHLLPIVGALMQPEMLAARGSVLDIPQDGTFRHLTVEGGPNISYATFDSGVGDNSQKRLLQAVWLISIPTEVVGPITDLHIGAYPRVSQVDIDLSIYTNPNDLTRPEIEEAFGLVASRPAMVGWNTASLNS
jgi:hypothetical protein